MVWAMKHGAKSFFSTRAKSTIKLNFTLNVHVGMPLVNWTTESRKWQDNYQTLFLLPQNSNKTM